MTTVDTTHPQVTTLPATTFTGTLALWRLIARRDRVLVTGTVAALLLLLAGTAAQYARLFTTQAARDAFVDELAGNSALTAFTGQLYDSQAGNLLMWKIGDIAFTLVAMFGMILVVRHTRTEEETGRAETTESAVVGPLAPLAAALLHVTTVSIVTGGLAAVSLTAFGLGAAGSATFGLALALPGIIFGSVAALTAQLSTQAAVVSRLAATALGAAYLIRFCADGSGLLWLRWLTPLGWSHLIEPYGQDRLLIAMLPLTVSAALITVALRLRRQRDLGAGVLPVREGPARAAVSLSNELGLAWRQHRGSVGVWAGAIAVLATATAGVAAGMPEIVDRSGDYVRELFTRYADRPDAPITDTFVWTVLYSIAGFGTLFPMLTILRLRSEETDGQAELLLSHPVTRARWATAHIGIAMAGAAALMLVAGLAAGLSFAVTLGEISVWPRVMTAALVLIPPLWLTGSVAALAVGLVPKAARVVVWIVFLLVNLFGESIGPALGLDYAVADTLVPFHHVPKVLTGAPLDLVPLVVMTALAAAVSALGILSLRWRDLA